MNLRPWLQVILLSLAANGAALADGGSAAAGTRLDPIEIHPQPDPLDQSMQRLRKSMEDPDCRGCPPELRAYRKSVYEQIGEVIGFITGAGLEPPQLSPAERTQIRVRNEWRKTEWGPEMDDFR